MQEIEHTLSSEDPLEEHSLDKFERMRYGSRPTEFPIGDFSWDGGSRLAAFPNSAAQNLTEENYAGTAEDG